MSGYILYSPSAFCSQAENYSKKTEYVVYIHYESPMHGHTSKWEKTSTTTDRNLALEQASLLFDSEKYTCVEIHKKYFCRVDQIFKTRSIKSFYRRNRTYTEFFLRKIIDMLANFLLRHVSSPI